MSDFLGSENGFPRARDNNLYGAPFVYPNLCNVFCLFN